MHPGTGETRGTLLAGLAGELRGPDYSGILYLGPTRLYLHRWLRDVFHPMAGQCYIPPHTGTLKKYARDTAQANGHNVINTALRPSIIASLSGHGQGFSTLISGLAGELWHRYPGMKHSEIKDLIFSQIEEMDLPDEVVSRIDTAMDAIGQYGNAMHKAGYIDEERALFASASLIDEANSVGRANSVGGRIDCLVLDGFYELTEAEAALAKALAKTATRTLITIPTGGPDDDLKHCFSGALCHELGIVPEDIRSTDKASTPWLNPATSKDAEIEDMARHIKQRHLAGTMKSLEDILIVFPGLSGNRETTRRVFSRYGVPLNLESPNAPMDSGHWEDIMSLLRSVVENYPRLEFARFLTSPNFRKIPPEVRAKAPAASLRSGMVKGKQSWLEALATDEAHKVFKHIDPLEKIRHSASFTAFSNAIITMLRKFDFRAPADAISSAEGLAEVESTLARLRPCDEISPRPLALAQYIEALQGLLSHDRADYKTPGAVLASIFEVRGMEPRVLYMGGLKDGEIPSRMDMDLMLPEGLRRRLGLADMDRHMALQEKIFHRLISSATEVYLSYASQEEDKLYLPSVFISDIKERSYRVTGHYSAQEAMTAARGKPFSEGIREIDLPGAYDKKRAFGVTEIDSCRLCPRKFAIERVLRLDPPGITEYEIEPMTLGSIAHKIMEDVIDGPPGTFEEFSQKATQRARSVLDKADMDEFFKEILAEAFTSVLRDIYEAESTIYEEGYRIAHREHKVEGEPIAGITLRGKADRIDMDSEGMAEVIDYKTGRAMISGAGVEKRGETLQLFLYAAMLRATGLRTRRVGIYSLKDLKVKWVPGSRDKEGLDHYIDAALSWLQQTAAQMRSGEFPATPVAESACHNCHEKPFCPHYHGPSARRRNA